jgi:hypothetical protein
MSFIISNFPVLWVVLLLLADFPFSLGLNNSIFSCPGFFASVVTVYAVRKEVFYYAFVAQFA